MFAKRSRHVAQHWIRVSRDRHQIGRGSLEHDLFRQVLQFSWSNAHMKSGADIESHRDAVKLGHDGVFKARTQQLLARAEDFWSDESGYIVHNHPTACPLLNEPRNAVRSRFERHHVNTFGGLIRDCGTLTRLEVEAIKSRCKREQTINVESHHPEDCLRSSGKTLKADIHSCL